jgi:hypothetical protein
LLPQTLISIKSKKSRFGNRNIIDHCEPQKENKDKLSVGSASGSGITVIKLSNTLFFDLELILCRRDRHLHSKITTGFTLTVSAGDTTIVLAENVLISDIPGQPYIIKSKSTGILAGP